MIMFMTTRLFWAMFRNMAGSWGGPGQPLAGMTAAARVISKAKLVFTGFQPTAKTGKSIPPPPL